ncbi:hydroxypyruvate isomerase family protein [Sagittula sp.]|uniref:hydroxypyruvate isomerase family protein n=1 Tax=Sagittula sp. TaxID=2038081 RepID=UPI0035133E85
MSGRLTFSANLGFLWTDRPLPDAIRAAGAAGFDAVECHWPYDIPAVSVLDALADTGLPLLSVNTRRGSQPGDFGLSALPGREAEAHAAIAEAVNGAVALGARMVHVMAGKARGPKARAAYHNALRHACALAAPHGLTILIEPINQKDAPGYFLRDTAHARRIIETLGLPNLKLMFDCYHVQRAEGDVIHHLRDLLPVIGHIQFAGALDRGPPDEGELNYTAVFEEIAALGWTAPLGAEYRPGPDTDATLGWLARARSI